MTENSSFISIIIIIIYEIQRLNIIFVYVHLLSEYLAAAKFLRHILSKSYT